MEVILQEDFPSLGYVGDKVAVRRGYARNYLLPRGIAVEVTSRNHRMLEHKLTAVRAKRNRLKTLAEEVAQKLSQEVLEFELKVGDKGKTFGSISSREVLDALVKKGYKLERKQVRLLEAIRNVGEFVIEVKLHSEVTVQVPVKVTGKIMKKSPEAEAAPEKKAKGRKRKQDDELSAAEEGQAEEAEEASESEESAEEEAEESDEEDG